MRMNEKKRLNLALAALALLAILPVKRAMAEADSGPLLAELTHVYRLASPAIETDGSSTFVRGTLLLVQQPGVVGYNKANIALEEMCPARFQEGELTPPRSVVCNVPTRQARKAFPISDPVCVTAFRLSEETDNLSIYLIECGAGAKVGLDRTFYALVDIQLPKGTLRTGSIGAVLSEIGKVLAPQGTATALKPSVAIPSGPAATTDPQPEEKAPQGTAAASKPSETVKSEPAAATNPKPEQQQPEQPQQEQPQQEPKEPQRLPPPLPPLAQARAGETSSSPAGGKPTDPPAGSSSPGSAAQVVVGQSVDVAATILGTPSIIGKAGVKLIYIYPQRFKIVFLKGKVTEIHSLDNSQ
jgi:hypothetical protein